jgi:hypothetical protein
LDEQYRDASLISVRLLHFLHGLSLAIDFRRHEHATWPLRSSIRRWRLSAIPADARQTTGRFFIHIKDFDSLMR